MEPENNFVTSVDGINICCTPEKKFIKHKNKFYDFPSEMPNEEIIKYCKNRFSKTTKLTYILYIFVILILSMIPASCSVGTYLARGMNNEHSTIGIIFFSLIVIIPLWGIAIATIYNDISSTPSPTTIRHPIPVEEIITPYLSCIQCNNTTEYRPERGFFSQNFTFYCLSCGHIRKVLYIPLFREEIKYTAGAGSSIACLILYIIISIICAMNFKSCTSTPINDKFYGSLRKDFYETKGKLLNGSKLDIKNIEGRIVWDFRYLKDYNFTDKFIVNCYTSYKIDSTLGKGIKQHTFCLVAKDNPFSDNFFIRDVIILTTRNDTLIDRSYANF